MPLPEIPERYEALEELSRSETGILVRARDRTLLREVVLKLPAESPPSRSDTSSRPADDSRERDRLLGEARALARVRHPNVERLLDVIETPAGPVLVLEPSHGETLAERLARETRLDATSVRDIAVQVSSALEAVHAIGVLHRGLGVDQILLCTDGGVRVIGFTFAKLGAAGLSLAGQTSLQSLGRGARRGPAPPHPAPEQLLRQKADARSDIFGLGWVLYECLTGQPPYPIELDVEHWKTPPDPRRLVPQTPSDLSAVVMKCLAISPLKRFASASELRAALLRPTQPMHAESAAADELPARRIRRPLVLAGMAVLALLASYVGWRVLERPSSARDDNRSRGAVSLGDGARSPEDRRLAGRPYDTLHAVIIGIDKYEHWPRLSCAVADAQAIKALLIEKFGFLADNVTELLDERATRDEIRHVLGGELKARTKQADGVFVFFAGHGQTEDLPGGGQTGYLVPVGGSVEEERNQETLIPMSEIQAFARLIPAKHVFFVIDACFSGFAASSRGLPSEDQAYVGFLAREPARLVLTAGGRNQQVSETTSLGHSFFTSRFLHGLENETADLDGNGVITAGEIAAYVQSNVPRDTAEQKQPQVPQYTSLTNDEGQFLFLTARVRGDLK